MKPDTTCFIAHTAKVLSDPIRLQILTLLREGRRMNDQAPACSMNACAVCPEDLIARLGAISSSKLSYHLKELKEAGFIRECREGKRIYYLFVPDLLEQWMESIRHHFLTQQDA
jgi:ArsR family transcriptional regulator